ncbi:tandem-95 repeat protein, partial [bacterium]|nr:tandem-95 repeat protein [bacterium]
YVNVTPFSLSEVGTTYTSNTITLQEPRIIGLSLDASSAENWSTDNLISSYTTNGSVTQTASAWYRNGTPERLLYLPFEGGSTNALLDFSGSNNHVSTTGVITSIPSWDATSGPDGSGAFTFDGDDYLLADDIFPLNSPYTKTAWISVTGDDYRNIISSLYNGECDHHFKVNPDGTLNAGHSFGAPIVQDAIPLNSDQWYFVAVTFDFASGEMVLYKDGLEVDRDYVPEALRSVADETVLIGARDNIWGWKGSMDEPCLYDRALSAEQISSLYINGNNVIVPEETRGSDVWYVNVTPFSIFEVGTTYTSNTITVQEPEIIGLSLDASSAENLTIDNLISSYTTNGSVTQTASAWYRNGAPESLLYLPFEGGSTNALLDFSGSNNHVSTTGVITEVPSWDATSGPDGSGAFTFDGDDYLLAGDIFPLSSAYTKTAWINMTGSGYRNIMSSILHDDNNHTFKVDPSGIVGAGHSFGATVVQDVTPLSHDQWYFVAVTFDYLSGEMILYRDGIEIDRDIVPEALRSVADASVLIGAMDGSYIWQGSMDEPRLYDHVLSAEQISSLFNIGNSVITSEETESMDEWYVDVTPFSIFEIGSTYTSNTVTIHSVVVSDIPNQTVNEGATFSAIDLDDYVVDYEYDDSDLTWSSTGNSELIVNIDPVTHVATIDIPDINWYGSENISFTASNPKTDSDETEVIFTVQNINDAPVLTFNGGEITDEDNTITGISVVFSDLDPSDAHTISIVSSDPNVTVEHLSGHISSSTYDLEPAENWNGTSQITVTVTDNGTGTLSDSETYILMINPINDAPVLTEVGNQIGNEDNSLIGLSVVFTDPDAADLHTISVVSDEANVSVESLSGHISGSTYDLVPAEDWNGSAQITVTVTDNGTGILSDSETYTFTVNAINDAPVLTEIGNQTVNEDNTLSGLSVVFTDIDASDAHTIAVVSDEANVSVESLSGNTSGSTYDLVPFADWIGTAQITVTVTDNGSGALSVSETYTLTVHETNDAPVLTLIGDQAIDEDNTLSGLSVIFTDLEAFDTHTIAVVSNEANVSVLNLSGHISGSTYDLVPEADWNGTAQITVTVTDDGPGTLFDSETYTLTVNATGDAPVLTLIGDQAIDEDNTLSGLSVIFTD